MNQSTVVLVIVRRYLYIIRCLKKKENYVLMKLYESIILDSEWGDECIGLR